MVVGSGVVVVVVVAVVVVVVLDVVVGASDVVVAMAVVVGSSVVVVGSSVVVGASVVGGGTTGLNTLFCLMITLISSSPDSHALRISSCQYICAEYSPPSSLISVELKVTMPLTLKPTRCSSATQCTQSPILAKHTRLAALCP